MLNIKTMQYLESIYKSKSFTRASEELHISQPAISEAIANLEKELGFVMMHRTPQSLAFTSEGEEFMRYVKRTLDHYEHTLEVAQELSDLHNARLHMGISPSVGMNIFSLVYTKYAALWPGVKVQIDEGPMFEQIDKIQREVIELAYNALPNPGEFKGLKLMPLTKAPIYVVLRPGHPWCKRDKISIADFDGQNIVLLNEESKIRVAILEEFAKKGVVPHIISSHYQVFSMLQMVKVSNSIGFINDSPGCSFIALLKDKYVLKPFVEPVYFPVGFMHKEGKKLSKAAKHLIGLVKAELEEQNNGERI